MTDATLKLELNSFLTGQSPDDSSLIRKAPWKFVGLCFLVLGILAYFLCDYAIQSRQQELTREVQKRLDISASGKAQVIETWLDSRIAATDRIAKNDLFRLFATEISLAKDGKLPKALGEQLPYMQNAFTSFARQEGLIGAYLLGRDGRAYLASGGAPTLTDTQREAARELPESSGVTFLPFRTGTSELVFDYLLPIHAAQNTADGVPQTVGVLLLTSPASGALASLLKPNSLGHESETTRLFQERDGKYFELMATRMPYTVLIEDDSLTPGNTGFQELTSKDGKRIFASGATVTGTGLTVFQQIDADEALAPVKTYALFIIGLAASFLVIIFAILIVIWLLLKGQNVRALAHQYREFAGQINVQRRLLGSINNTIDELISLTDPEGRYIYANPSLARLADCPIRSIPGKTDRDLFGEKAARDFAEHDRKAIATEQTVNAFVEIDTRDGVRTLRIAKSRFLNEEGVFLGIVTVASDITDYVEHQRRKEAMDRKTITVLSQMLEANDPYLRDHSNRMAQLARHISNELGLSPDVARIIDTGAHLSQIGKISIPREIRQKETRLTEKEQRIMQGHVQTAEKILLNAEVEKDIVDAVTQINEHLDGSGYPKGLSADEIDIPARILGMADILIARISPRSYREAIGVDEAMRVFRNNPEKYDPQIVDALLKFFETPEGAAFKAEIEAKRG
jgi:HD-GYP domain-containing protein (c-di-GMP phosphodiesterase class II)